MDSRTQLPKHKLPDSLVVRAPRHWDDAFAFLDGVDDQLASFARRVDAVSERGHLQTHLGLLQLQQRWAEKKPEILRGLRRLRAREERALGALDDAKLFVALGGMEARDGVRQLSDRLRQTERKIERLRINTVIDVRMALRALGQAVGDMRRELAH